MSEPEAATALAAVEHYSRRHLQLARIPEPLLLPHGLLARPDACRQLLARARRAELFDPEPAPGWRYEGWAG